ncbi:MAG: Endoribonuclease [Candidatus Tokpelaia sp. JSC189]|nr:MAG: Endoribonuclease [Candidatus Tokpelaia sp. JSC189]
MFDVIQSRLANLGISIPQIAMPVGSYVTTIRSGKQLFISGQLPLVSGKLLTTGKVGATVDIENAKKAAQICAINILAQAQAELGNLAKIKQVIKITAFVAADPTFTDIPQIANGASDLLVNVLGEAGKHTRSAVGVSVLPMDATVEIETVMEI